ncbi:MAG: helix-turn-helix transcriptional regulator [Candidatus Eremiobacteraeota bacterium]|nr:helix-turn-helix transcriptional regulator [Candidatus Eremiobacteraeota bacterium]
MAGVHDHEWLSVTFRLGVRPIAPRAPDPIKSLTKREGEVARLVALGKTSPEIGRDLELSQRTIENHIGAIFKKLGLSTRAQLAVLVASHQASRRTELSRG